VSSPLRIATIVLGAFFALQGIVWLALPARAAEGLGMPLLDGVARSTQVGDFAAFFLVVGATMLAGARPGASRLLLVPAGALSAAALGRGIAWAFHGAAFAATFIAIEVAVALLLVAASRSE
jgi:hypothetical protein